MSVSETIKIATAIVDCKPAKVDLAGDIPRDSRRDATGVSGKYLNRYSRVLGLELRLSYLLVPIKIFEGNPVVQVVVSSL